MHGVIVNVDHETVIKKLKIDYDIACGKIQFDSSEELNKIKHSHELSIQEIHSNYSEQISEMKHNFEGDRKEHAGEIERLRSRHT